MDPLASRRGATGRGGKSRGQLGLKKATARAPSPPPGASPAAPTPSPTAPTATPTPTAPTATLQGARWGSIPPTALFDVSGMMCGGCAARVRAILAADPRVETAAVNLLAESAAVRLRAPAAPGAGEELAARLTECGFPATARRGGAAAGAGESARKWREMAARKEELIARSRGRVAFAWTLVALCCGIATAALLGPGRDILFDGFRAFKQGSPNMNSLVGFGSAAAFSVSAVSLLNLS